MKGQFPHDMLPGETHDEGSRRDFVSSLKDHVTSHLGAGNRTVYDERAVPVFRKKHGRAPENRREVASVMYRDAYWRTWSSLNRSAQEMMWDSLGECIERQLPDLIARARKATAKRGKLGSLELDPSLDIPAYSSRVDIHSAPGGYHTELTSDDVYAGALFDLCAYDDETGGLGPMNDDIGAMLAAYLGKRFPRFEPSRILDIGCGVGHQTLPFVDAYPEAEVYGCDLGAPMLRYGHARAETLGKRVHFSQQNAEATDFDDESFDLVTSTIVLHETSARALSAIFRECRRLLRPGGMMAHSEFPDASRFWPDPYDQFRHDWSTEFNAEPFRSALRDTDVQKVAIRAGFGASKMKEARIPGLQHPTADWWVFVARK